MSRPGVSGPCARRLAQPVDLPQLHHARPARFPYLLQSTARHPQTGRYDILLALAEPPCVPPPGRFFPALEAQWQRERSAHATTTLPFGSGWFLYLGYGLAREVEPSLPARLADPGADGLPIAFATRCRGALIHDHLTGLHWAVAETAAQLQTLLEQVEPTPPAVAPPGRWQWRAPPPVPFLEAVARVREYLLAGDVFQANLSHAWLGSGQEPVPIGALYRALAMANPAPFAASIYHEGTVLLSSSPERLLALRAGRLETRPIAGTCPRSGDAAVDARAARRLRASAKERAEHVMLVDMERNDLGRVCRPGSVRVAELMQLERYAHVQHLVSSIVGELADGRGPVDAIRAVFPGGSITGCPKVRCMEIIDALEAAPRGAYTGSCGYLDRSGQMDLNILIRTAWYRDNQLGFRTGSGIVADSKPRAELAETHHKAAGMLKAWPAC